MYVYTMKTTTQTELAARYIAQAEARLATAPTEGYAAIQRAAIERGREILAANS